MISNIESDKLESPCNVCGSNEFEVLFQGGDLMLEIDGDFRWVRCSTCGTLRQNPMPSWEELEKSYPPDYGSYTTLLPRNASLFQRITKRLGQWKRVNFVQKYCSSGSWLDIGSGSGQILQEALFRNQWQLFGLEPNQFAAKYSSDFLELPIQNCTIEEFLYSDKKFDLITMWDVLEHISTPTETIKMVSNMLNDDGIFIFQFPNLASFDRQVFGKYWNGYDLPRHLYLFPEEVIKNILQKNGFQIIEKKCIAGTYESYLLSLKFFNRSRNSPVIRFVTENKPFKFFLKLITFPLIFLADRLNAGTHITYSAKKVGCGD